MANIANFGPNKAISGWNLAPYLATEQTAIDLAQEWGLIPREVACPSCCMNMGQEVHMSSKLGYRYRCRRQQCGDIRVSPLKNTFFDKMHVSVQQTMQLMYHFFTQQKVRFAAEETGVTRKTAIQVFHYLREVMNVAEHHDATQIGGPRDVVEVDQTHLFTQKYHRGRRLRHQVWCFGIISRSSGRVYIEEIDDKTRPTLDGIMRAHIRPGSYLMSDYHRSYINCDYRLMMRGHGRVNHRRRFVEGTVEVPGIRPRLGHPVRGTRNVRVKVHTNKIERVWRELKAALRTCRRRRAVPRYIGEFLYRKNILNRLQTKTEMFLRFMRDIARVYPGPNNIGRGMRNRACQCRVCAP